MTMTTKQVAERVRKALATAAAGGGLVWEDGRRMVLPHGLGFTVRATRTGVNITIEDRGYVDTLTGGDREHVTFYRFEMDAITAEVDKIRDNWQPHLPGETKWGPIFISARATSVRTIEATS